MYWEIDLLFELSLLGYNARQPQDISTFLRIFLQFIGLLQRTLKEESKLLESKPTDTRRQLIKA